MILDDIVAHKRVEVAEQQASVPLAALRSATAEAWPTRSFAEALARHSRPHDRFTCPHAAEPWHARACALRQEIDRTPSRRLAAVMEQELSELCAANLRNRQSTRNNEGGAS